MCLIASIIKAFERLGGKDLGKEIKDSLEHYKEPLTSIGDAQRLNPGSKEGQDFRNPSESTFSNNKWSQISTRRC